MSHSFLKTALSKWQNPCFAGMRISRDDTVISPILSEIEERTFYENRGHVGGWTLVRIRRGHVVPCLLRAPATYFLSFLLPFSIARLYFPFLSSRMEWHSSSIHRLLNRNERYQSVKFTYLIFRIKWVNSDRNRTILKIRISSLYIYARAYVCMRYIYEIFSLLGEKQFYPFNA